MLLGLAALTTGLLAVAITPGADLMPERGDRAGGGENVQRVPLSLDQGHPASRERGPEREPERESDDARGGGLALAAAAWPAALRERRAREAARDPVATPLEALEGESGERVNGSSRIESELWMEPFLPFYDGPSIDQIVSAMADSLPDPEEKFERVEVRSGDSLAVIFSRAGLTPAELHRVMNADDKASALARIHPGEEILFRVREEGGLDVLRYKLDETRTLIIEREDETDSGFRVSVHEEVLETRQLHASGSIDRSLYLSGRRAGLSNRHIMQLMTIFEWRVDFNRDIRNGDAFSIVYEADFVNGEKVRDGRIVAASFINRGRRHEAVYYEDPEGNGGYYDADGENLRKAFIRRPVQNARISSGFNRNRMHPVLGVRRPHLGTDFAAPTGTPILASGNGRVVHVGRHGGYGQTVVIQHTNQIRTLYAHMSRYASGIRDGARVDQGQVIGYVGATGLATGPHLHYEFKVNGSHKDPMRVSLPSGDPVPEKHHADFQARTSSLLAHLDEVTETQLAMRGED